MGLRLSFRVDYISPLRPGWVRLGLVLKVFFQLLTNIRIITIIPLNFIILLILLYIWSESIKF